MAKGIIVDDEQHGAHSLLRLLKPYEQKLSIVAVYDDVDGAVDGIKLHRPDIVFLDVQLKNGSTGFDILRALDQVAFHVVFTTAFDHYAVQAFRFSALDYLLKPVDEEELSASMGRFFEIIKKEQQTQHVDVLLANLSAVGKHRKIGIPTVDGYIFLEVGQILRCHSDINYTEIFTIDKKKYTVSKTLKYFEGLLSGYGFFRVHNSHLINLDYVTKYTKGKGGYITMADHSTIEVSFRRKEEFLKTIRQS